MEFGLYNISVWYNFPLSIFSDVGNKLSLQQPVSNKMKVNALQKNIFFFFFTF